jgi:hypothetical protein
MDENTQWPKLAVESRSAASSAVMSAAISLTEAAK